MAAPEEGFERFGRRRPGSGTPLASRRGRIAQTWWSSSFIDELQSGRDAGRLSRGRTYARSGQVAELRPRAGAVTARVQGSRPRPYLVEILVRRWTPAEVEAVVAVTVENPLLLAPLFAGDVPRAMPDLLAETGVELLPAAGHLAYDCSCPDAGDPCKHAAATVYVLAERLDEDPTLLFLLRGIPVADLLRRIESAASGQSTAEPGPDPAPERFHRLGGPVPELTFARRAPGRTVADDLDETLLGPGGDGLADALRPFYARLRESGG
ncbi:SWIM zinc finger family protein [Kineococcus gynurae]|uniref:SWIM zinc finger family protein n=1 Tax=Kineococcus gynurae TaxID=452979 RepID=A0ABV5LNU8_9ACTN